MLELGKLIVGMTIIKINFSLRFLTREMTKI